MTGHRPSHRNSPPLSVGRHRRRWWRWDIQDLVLGKRHDAIQALGPTVGFFTKPLRTVKLEAYHFPQGRYPGENFPKNSWVAKNPIQIWMMDTIRANLRVNRGIISLIYHLDFHSKCWLRVNNPNVLELMVAGFKETLWIEKLLQATEQEGRKATYPSWLRWLQVNTTGVTPNYLVHSTLTFRSSHTIIRDDQS